MIPGRNQVVRPRDRYRNASRSDCKLRNIDKPTLELFEIDGLDIATCQILYVGDQGVGVLSGVVWEPRYEGLEVRVCPGVTC